MHFFGIFAANYSVFSRYSEQKDNERKHVGTASRRDVTTNEIAVQVVNSCFGEVLKQVSCQGLHVEHRVVVGAIYDVGIVEVAHDTQQGLVLHVRVVALDACLVERKPFAEELAVAFARIVERTLQTASCLGCLFGLAAVCASGVGETIGKVYYYGR